MNGFWPSIVAIATAIVGLAVVAVVLSPKANTAQVVTASFGGFANSLTAATNPYSGASASPVGSMSFGDLGGLLDNLGTNHL